MGANGFEFRVTECSHPEDEELHRDVAAWASEWAARLLAEAPPQSPEERGIYEHPALAMSRMRTGEIFESTPERLRTCMMADPLLVDRAISHALRE
jgi:hypothetical protein